MATIVPKNDLPTENYVPEDDLPVPTDIKNPIDVAEIKNRPEEYTLSPSTVALGGLIGSIAGGIYPKLVKSGASVAMGALEGGITGLGSSATGEIIREATNNSNVGQLTALGAEILTGGALPLARDVITRLPPAALMAGMGYAKAKTAQAVLGESHSSRIAKTKIFGSETIEGGVAGTKYTDAFDESSAIDMANKFGLTVPKGMKAQDVVRRDLYDTIDLQGASGVTMKNSPVYSELMRELAQGVKDGVVKADDVKSIAALLNGQGSTNSKTMVSFKERLLNTAQQATKEHNGVKISDDAADMLKKAIDKYTGKPYYSTLKAQEKQRFTAKAMDDIPVLLEGGIKGDALETSLRNLSTNPYGKENFQVALSSYLRALPEKEALSEWNRLYSSGILTRTKVMDMGDLLSLNRKVKQYTEKGYLKKAGDITGHALKMSLITGVMPSEATRFAKEKDSLQPFNM
jgi:hypothetical protein